MKVGYHCKNQICSLLLIFVFLILGFNSELSLGQHQCQHSHDHEHEHEHHHHHDDHDLGVKKLPEELAEEEDLRMEFMSHHHDHGTGSELTGAGLWINAMGCSLLVSLASLICLILLPLIFFQGKPSKAFVDALAVFGAGAMLGDAFLHQLPHAFGGGGGHSHSHDDHAHEHIVSGHGHDHAPSHSHSIEDLSVGLSILSGIVVFLLVEKVVRYVEESSGGDSSWCHHHHHHKKSESLQDVSGGDDMDKQTTRDEGKVSETASDESLKTEKQSEPSLLRKRNTSTNGVGDKIDSAAENGPGTNIKSVMEKEPVGSSSLVFGYLNLFSDGVEVLSSYMGLSVGGQEHFFYLRMSFLKR